MIVCTYFRVPGNNKSTSGRLSVAALGLLKNASNIIPLYQGFEATAGCLDF